MGYKVLGGSTLVLTVMAVGVYYFAVNSNRANDVTKAQLDSKIAQKEFVSKKTDINRSIQKISKINKNEIDKNRVSDKKLDEVAKDLDKINQEAPLYIKEAKNQLALVDEQYEDLQNNMKNVDKMLEESNKELGIDTQTIEQEVEDGFSQPATSQSGKEIQKNLDKTEEVLNNIEKSLDELSKEEEQ